MADWDERDLQAGDADDESSFRDGHDALGESDPSDFPLQSPMASEWGQFAWAVWAAAVLVVVTAGIFFYQRWSSSGAEAVPEPSEAVALPEPETEPPGDEAESGPEPEEPPEPLPELNESDAFVRELLQTLSAHPALAAFFVDEGLVRRGVVLVVNVAEGDDPTRHVRHLGPEEKFAVVRRGARLYIDRNSYSRYDGLAAGFASLDAEGTAALYRRLKPLIDEAYRELGYLDQPFEAMLASAMRKLADVPVTSEALAVYPVSVNYQYEDEYLAGLEPAQKLLLRMGPDNVRTIQFKLRELAAAFGISF